MKNRLHLDFTLVGADERRKFLRDYIERIEFKPTADELEMMGNYILWGEVPKKNYTTSENKSNVEGGRPYETVMQRTINPTNESFKSSKRAFNKKNTVAAQAGIELRTRHGTWDTKEKAESLDALIETPNFNEALISSNPIHYTTPKATFSRAEARKKAPPEILAILEDLWSSIDRLELMLNFYDLESGKRKKPPRNELLHRFTADEQDELHARAAKLNPYSYLKKRHELVELRKQQFTYKDYYAPTIFANYHAQENSRREIVDEHISWDCDIAVAPLGLYYKGLKFSELIFRLEFDPAQYTEEELVELSRFYWKKVAENREEEGLRIDFRKQEDVYQILNQVSILEECALRDRESHNTESTNAALLDTVWFYIEFAELSELQNEILHLKINGVKNQEIARHINQKYGKNYTTNYISTIFKQKIIKKINEAAQYHFEIIGNLFFPENFRKCNFCGRTLLLHNRNFVKKSKSTTGFNSKCKRCEKERRDKNKNKKGV